MNRRILGGGYASGPNRHRLLSRWRLQPNATSFPRFSEQDIVQSITCEIQRAYAQQKCHIPHWQADINLTLEVDNNSTLGPTSNFISSVTGGTVNIGFGASLSNTATRIDALNLSLDLDKLSNCGAPVVSGRNLMSDLKISEWLRDSIASAKDKQLVDKRNYIRNCGPTQPLQGSYLALTKTGVPVVLPPNSAPPFKAPLSFGHTVKFIVVADANLSPTLTLANFTLKGVSGSGPLADLKRTGTNTLILTISPTSQSASMLAQQLVFQTFVGQASVR
jgi:hypothetical protein